MFDDAESDSTGLTGEEELLLTLLTMSDENPAHIATMDEIVERLRSTPQTVDLHARALQRRRLVERLLPNVPLKPWTSAVMPADAAFLWRDQQSSGWRATKTAADTWLRTKAAGTPVDSNSLAEAAGLQPRSAAALMAVVWAASGVVTITGRDQPGNVVRAIATGLAPPE